MLIVLLLYFKSICLYFQQLVLHVHDHWINPKNVRLLTESTRSPRGGSKLFHQHQSHQQHHINGSSHVLSSSKSTKRKPIRQTYLNSSNSIENCRFCANIPQGYCRHHFHLQELRVKAQQFHSATVTSEYQQLRKIKRQLKQTLQYQQHHYSSQRRPYQYFPSSNFD